MQTVGQFPHVQLGDIAYAFPSEPVTLRVHPGVSTLALPVRDVANEAAPVFPSAEAAPQGRKCQGFSPDTHHRAQCRNG